MKDNCLWTLRKHEHTLPPTLRSLDQALNSELVGLGALVCNGETLFTLLLTKMLQCQTKHCHNVVASLHLSTVADFFTLESWDLCLLILRRWNSRLYGATLGLEKKHTELVNIRSGQDNGFTSQRGGWLITFSSALRVLLGSCWCDWCWAEGNPY